MCRSGIRPLRWANGDVDRSNRHLAQFPRSVSFRSSPRVEFVCEMFQEYFPDSHGNRKHLDSSSRCHIVHLHRSIRHHQTLFRDTGWVYGDFRVQEFVVFSCRPVCEGIFSRSWFWRTWLLPYSALFCILIIAAMLMKRKSVMIFFSSGKRSSCSRPFSWLPSSVWAALGCITRWAATRPQSLTSLLNWTTAASPFSLWAVSSPGSITGMAGMPWDIERLVEV